MVKFIKNVEIVCKSMLKSAWKSMVNLCEKLKNKIHRVEISTFPPTFPNFPTILSTTHHPLFLINLFHFFTGPTTNTINILKERN